MLSRKGNRSRKQGYQIRVTRTSLSGREAQEGFREIPMACNIKIIKRIKVRKGLRMINKLIWQPIESPRQPSHGYAAWTSFSMLPIIPKLTPMCEGRNPDLNAGYGA